MNEVNFSRRHALSLLLGGTALLGLRPAFALGSRVITFYGNQTIHLPEQIQRIASTWPAQNSIIAMLGYGDRIVATSRVIRDMPIFRKFVPSISRAIVAGATAHEISVEELMRVKPDILFVPGKMAPSQRQQLEEAGIEVVAFHDNSLAAIVERTLITGQILGGKAVRKAEDYRDYFNHNATRVQTALKKIPASQRLKVLHVMGNQLMTSSRPSLNQDWMDMGGAINVAEHWAQGRQYSVKASMEQILAADPDVIIVMRAPDAEAIRHDPAWSRMRAVRNGKVYANPRGMFWWCRETSEEALQFLWLAKTLYPDLLSDVDMHQETRMFYKRFYGYQLSDAEIQEFLTPTS